MNLLGKFLFIFRHWFTKAANFLFAYLGLWLARGGSSSCVLRAMEGSGGRGGSICVFLHYDSRGRIPDHTRLYIEALVSEGYSIIFVTNSGLLDPSGMEFATRLSRLVILRGNNGYDFGGFRDAILAISDELGSLDKLVIANDSVFGPVGSLKSFFSSVDFSVSDVWSATNSWQHHYHLQSYIVVFGPRALRHPTFLGFWKSVKDLRSKAAVIKFYEIGMTQKLMAGGLRCAAVWDYHRLLETVFELHKKEGTVFEDALTARCIEFLQTAISSAASLRVPLNPTHDLWLVLMLSGCPFLKRQLIVRNPNKVKDISVWHKLVRNYAPQLYGFVIEDMKRSFRSTAP